MVHPQFAAGCESFSTIVGVDKFGRYVSLKSMLNQRVGKRIGIKFAMIVSSLIVLVMMSSHASANSEPDAVQPSPANSDEIETELILNTDGVLESGDSVIYQDGSLYDEYPFEGVTGQHVFILLESTEFDPYLIVISPLGDILAQNDDASHDDLNSELSLTLPYTGTYSVIANGINRNSRGRYRLTIHSSTEAERQAPEEPLQQRD